jgi:hypothetical protein
MSPPPAPNPTPTPAGHPITLLVVNDDALGALRRACDVILMRSYREAARAAAGPAELPRLFEFALGWDAGEYAARRHTVASLRRDAALIRCAHAGVRTLGGPVSLCAALGLQRTYQASGWRAGPESGVAAQHRFDPTPKFVHKGLHLWF